MPVSAHENAIVTVSFEAGALIRGGVRQYFDEIRFKTDSFSYLESKGFFSSVFHLKGPRYLLRAMAALLEARYNEPRED